MGTKGNINTSAIEKHRGTHHKSLGAQEIASVEIRLSDIYSQSSEVFVKHVSP